MVNEIMRRFQRKVQWKSFFLERNYPGAWRKRLDDALDTQDMWRVAGRMPAGQRWWGEDKSYRYSGASLWRLLSRPPAQVGTSKIAHVFRKAHLEHMKRDTTYPRLSEGNIILLLEFKMSIH